ncbi:carbohydrate-binding family 9-like protein [Clostridium oryzae]|uniref:Carbohydrate-binding domain-containing protein n=1 Tax=Clostridium oryzae TaxID=1450648 RepID=A0A1V4IX23_9CLOT|nr:carbohydrate-binding family 9-like protein [Clostridium oryzae]OPJ64591.1 hypothetical protein CLORY_04590 [Clostridium oryzae]
MKLERLQEPKIEFAPKHYICKKAKEQPIIDGNLDKSFWADVQWTSYFEDIEGDLKPKPLKQTRLKMLWDDECLYFGAELEDDQIWATLRERDSVIFQDNDFEIFIDSSGETHHYYEFEMNAFNTIWDLMLTKPYRDNGKPINSWDIKGIKSAVKVYGAINNSDAKNTKWTVEIAMPWKSLIEMAGELRRPNCGEYWRINFSRVEWRTEVKEGKYRKCIDPKTGIAYPEYNWVWSPMGIINMHYPELWGFVVFSEEDEIEFSIPKDEKIKWQLRKLYYRQRNYYCDNGRYAADFNEIKGRDRWSIDPVIEVASDMYQITVPSEDKTSSICIREDGRVFINR